MDTGFWANDEGVLKPIVVMVIHLCEYSKNHGIVHFKMVNFICDFVIKNYSIQKKRNMTWEIYKSKKKIMASLNL